MKKFLLIGFGFILSLIVGEILLRLFNPQITINSLIPPYDFKCYAKDSYLYFKLKNSADCILKSNYGAFENIRVKTNSLGLRNPEISLQKAPDTKRILFIGDSFTMGVGVAENEAYPSIIEKLLNNSGTIKTETINAGVNATGPFYDFVYLKKYSLKLNPDIIVIGFLPGQDIAYDVFYSERVKETDSDGLAEKLESENTDVDNGVLRAKYLPDRFKIPILRSSHLFGLIMQALSPIKDIEKTYSSDLGVCLYKKSCNSLASATNQVKELFLDMSKLTNQRGVKLLVVIIPLEFEIYNDVSDKYLLSRDLLPTEKRSLAIEFEKFFIENNIEYVNLLPAFSSHEGEKTYLEFDPHWNPLGHKIAAEAISEKLMELLK